MPSQAIDPNQRLQLSLGRAGIKFELGKLLVTGDEPLTVVDMFLPQYNIAVEINTENRNPNNVRDRLRNANLTAIGVYLVTLDRKEVMLDTPKCVLHLLDIAYTLGRML